MRQVALDVITVKVCVAVVEAPNEPLTISQKLIPVV